MMIVYGSVRSSPYSITIKAMKKYRQRQNAMRLRAATQLFFAVDEASELNQGHQDLNRVRNDDQKQMITASKTPKEYIAPRTADAFIDFEKQQSPSAHNLISRQVIKVKSNEHA